MPALPSFITYKPGRKTKAVIKSPFSLLRGEPSASTNSIPASPSPHLFTSEVIDINDRGTRYSLDFDGGKPIDEYENDIIDQELRQPRAGTTASPQVQLDIDLSPEALTDWFAANFLQPEAVPQVPPSGGGVGKAGPSGLRTEVKRVVPAVGGLVNGSDRSLRLGDEDSDEDASEDVIANLQAMDASHFGKLPGMDFNLQDQAPPSKKPLAAPLSIPPEPSQSTHSQSIRSGDSTLGFKSSRFSFMETPASSAVSGSTLARALLSNTFAMPGDSRGSKYRSGGAGLTRSDSTTLPRGDHPSSSPHQDRFSIGPDAPPIPANAEFLYEPPKKSRAAELREKRRQNLKRRSSTGSLHHKALPETPTSPTNRPSSALISPGIEFDINSIFLTTPRTPPPPAPRSPLPPTPSIKPSKSTDFEQNSDQGSILLALPEGTRRLPDPQTPSPDLSLLSPTSDGLPSAKNMEDVLNYYSLPDSPEPLNTGGNYRPAFSPISEETSSQLSPPTPYRDRRESQRSTPIGARSPFSGSLRVRGESVPLPRRPSDARPFSRQILTQLSEGQVSTPELSSPPESVRSSVASSGSESLPPLAPPAVSTIFNRQRSGSLPSPIKVVRDPKDQNAYNITVTPLTSDSDTPTTEEGGAAAEQEFPETPDMFSPMFTGGTDPSHGVVFQTMEGNDVPPMPTTPTSAAIPGRGNGQPSLAQQLLLNRAGTTVRHSRQASLGKIKTSGLGGRSGSPSTRRVADVSGEAKSTIEEVDSPVPISRQASKDDLTSHTREPSNPIMAVDIGRSPSRGTIGTHSDSSIYTSESSTKSRTKTLPPIPNSPIVPSLRGISPSKSTTPSSIFAPEPAPVIAIAGPVIPPPPTNPPPSPSPSQKARAPPIRARPPPALTLSNSNPSASTVAVNGNDRNSLSSAESSMQNDTEPSSTVPTAPSAEIAPEDSVLPVLQGGLQYKEDLYTGRASDLFRGTSLGSPPPYYSVISDVHNASTPNIAFSGPQSFQYPDRSAGPVAGPSTSSGEWSSIEGGGSLGRVDSTISQRARARPPLPAGPRRPSQQQLFMSSPSHFHQHLSRDRSGSVSSVTSNLLLQQATTGARHRSNPMFSPKFQTPPPKWRGYTMEAAKWTFSSAQLQAIVSRAIRQSAEASSIRLLRLEVLDNEIPEEMRRLEAQRTDLKTRYKVLSRRRATLLDSLTNYMIGNGEDDATYALRLVEEVREMALTLDRLAEELHSLDGQLSHLDSLTHIHTGSALAMALRKLNASFLKQVAENQVLRDQIRTLESERDEAWQQAELAANELDRMAETIDSPTSKRSSRMSAVRKSSIRASKAGLRTSTQRLSSRSSLGSSLYGFALPSISRSPLPRLEKIPPVPSIPRRRPHAIQTGSPLKSSAALSATGFTPTSETRALNKAQDELYSMLGIINPERNLRRSRSMDGVSITSPPLTGQISLHHTMFLLPESASRRSSLPPDSTLVETYNAMAADRNAVLATIDMLSATD